MPTKCADGEMEKSDDHADELIQQLETIARGVELITTEPQPPNFEIMIDPEFLSPTHTRFVQRVRVDDVWKYRTEELN